MSKQQTKIQGKITKENKTSLMNFNKGSTNSFLFKTTHIFFNALANATNFLNKRNSSDL